MFCVPCIPAFLNSLLMLSALREEILIYFLLNDLEFIVELSATMHKKGAIILSRFQKAVICSLKLFKYQLF